ncbi:MAG: hypothetical protein Q4C67_08405 [Deinococcus sp.]|nr:hypothetical protein [Deinococcus sp.]
MGRRERFAQYQWAAWPDESLVAEPALVVEIADEYFQTAQVAEDGTWPHPAKHNRVLRLSWEHWSKEHSGGLSKGGYSVSHSNQIFAVETYLEEYSGPYGDAYSGLPDTPHRFLHEVVNDPNPWITELLEDNPRFGVFPTSSVGGPVQVHPDTWEQNKRHWEPPTGRYHSPQWQGSLSDAAFFWSGAEEPTPEQWAEAQRQIEENKRQQAELERSRPRYRHLFIASESVMVEILCEGLPRWEWVVVPEEG